MPVSDRQSRLQLLRASLGVAALLAAAGCGGAQPTNAPETGITTVAPPATASPAPTASPALTPAASFTPLPPVKISIQKVVGGLPGPIGAVSAGDSRMFVIGQTGRIVIVEGGVVKATFLDISARLSSGGERGLLGLAFHPEYPANGRFFVRYTDKTGDLHVSEFRVSSDPDRADPASEKTLLTVRHRTYANHNGGTIAFGPDGYLYVGTGDGGGGGDPSNNGQNLASLLGKLLRVDVDHPGSLPYAVPSDNPFAGVSGKLGEIWAFGLRNPYGFSFDSETGDLWIADVGQGSWEEVDRATRADGLGRGANYGWSVMEGRHCYKPASGCKTAGMVLPLAEYNHGAGDSTGCSVIGGFVYRGRAHPELEGRYFFGDYCSGKIWNVAAGGPAAQAPQLLLSAGLRITGWGQGADGELYLTATDGGLYRLV